MARSSGPDVVVIGGGIIGCACAYYLAREKLKVVVLERGAVASQASGGAIGLLSADSNAVVGDVLRRAGRESRDLYVTIASKFKRYYGIDVELELCGVLRVARSRSEELELRKGLSTGWGGPLGLEWLDPAEVKRRVPALTARTYGGLFYKNDGQVSSWRAAAAFRAGAEKLGVKFHEYAPVTGFVTKGTKVAGVEAKKTRLIAEHVVLAAGTWSGLLAEKTGVKVPLEPVRGQVLIFGMEERLLPFPIILGKSDYYLAPKPDKHLYAGTTKERAGFDPSTTDKAMEMISGETGRWVPGVLDLPYKGNWGGLRPVSPDGNPIIGPAPGRQGLWLATGHAHWGIVMAPYTGRALARMITGKPSEVPWEFNPARFS